MSVGDRILALRKDQGLSQGDLAKRLNVSRQAVSKWEQDITSPDTLHLIKLADALETEVEFLATGKKPVYEEAPIVFNIVKKPDSVPEKVVEKVIEKPILKRIVRIKYLRNPFEFAAVAIVSFLIGYFLGHIT